MRITHTATLLALTLTTAAHAGDLHDGSLKDVGMEPPHHSWTGFSLGLGGGIGATLIHSDVDLTDVLYDDSGEGGPFGPLDSYDSGGETSYGFFTVQLGYDVQFKPRWVAGAFFNYDVAGGNEDKVLDFVSFEVNDDPGRFVEYARSSVEMGDSWTAGGRLGVLATPDTLVYALGGYTEIEARLRAEYGGRTIEGGVTTLRNYAGSRDAELSGFTVGAGIETMFKPGWSLKLEYRYTGLDDASLDVAEGSPNEFDPANLMETDSEFELHTARAVLSYRPMGW